MAATTVNPATMTKERTATIVGFMATSHLDLGDAPDHEEADRLHDEARSYQKRPDRVAEQGLEVSRVQDLEHQPENDRAQSHEDRGVLVLCRQDPRVAHDFEPLADHLGEPLEDLGQVPAGAALDPDRGAEEADVLRRHPSLEPVQGLAGVAA